MTALYGTVNNLTNMQEQCDRSIGLAEFQANPLLVNTLEPLHLLPMFILRC